METLSLKYRNIFLNLYLNPAINEVSYDCSIQTVHDTYDRSTC